MGKGILFFHLPSSACLLSLLLLLFKKQKQTNKQQQQKTEPVTSEISAEISTETLDHPCLFQICMSWFQLG